MINSSEVLEITWGSGLYIQPNLFTTHKKVSNYESKVLMA